jgi:hypothetical protein
METLAIVKFSLWVPSSGWRLALRRRIAPPAFVLNRSNFERS